MTNVEKIYQSKIDYCQNIYEAVNGADALVICTEWSIFRSPDFSRIKSLMAYPAIFDGRNLYDTITLQEEGFYYSSIGRALVQPQ
jgi:UDPglucose 6-dehydrogenase